MKIKSSKNVFSGRHLKLFVENTVLPNGNEFRLEVIRGLKATAVVPFSEDGSKILLIRQFRPAIAQWVLEIPAGILNPNESPEAGAQRELEEETGFTAHSFEKILDFYPAIGYSDEIIYIFKAIGLKKGTKNLDHCEMIEEHFFDRDQIIRMMNQKEIIDPKSFLGLYHCLFRGVAQPG